MSPSSSNPLLRCGRFGLVALFLSASLFALACASACLGADLASVLPASPAPTGHGHCGNSSSAPSPVPSDHKNNCPSHGRPAAFLLAPAAAKLSPQPLPAVDSLAGSFAMSPLAALPASSLLRSAGHGPPGNFLRHSESPRILRI